MPSLPQVRAALAQRAAEAAVAAGTELEGWGGAQPAGPPLPGDLPDLALELAALTAGSASMQALQVG